MARRFHLQSLLDLAQNHTDAAGRHLHQLKMKWNEAEEKLGQLQAFREEYRLRYQHASSQGISVAALRDFQVFLGKLEEAITLQFKEVEQCRARWEDGQHAWMEQRRKLNAYDTLSKRHHKAEQRRESKQEQKQQDEYSSQSFTRRPKSDEGSD